MVERKRHLAKAVSYRLFGSMATGAIALAFTGRVDLAAGVGVADTVVKLGLYYLHERLWYRIRWGVHPGVPSDDAGTQGGSQSGQRAHVRVD